MPTDIRSAVRERRKLERGPKWPSRRAAVGKMEGKEEYKEEGEEEGCLLGLTLGDSCQHLVHCCAASA